MFNIHIKRINLKIVPSTVIVLIELGWWNKLFSSKATLLPVWSHHSKNYTVVIMNRLTVMKYQYLKWWLIFFLLHIIFISSITENTWLRETGTTNPSRGPEFTPVFWWVRVAHHVRFMLYGFFCSCLLAVFCIHSFPFRLYLIFI